MLLPEDLENIEDFYRQHLGDLEVTPSKELWGRIETDLNKRKSRTRIIVWSIATISVISLLAVLYFYESNNNQPTSPIEPSTVHKTVPATKIEQPLNNSIPASKQQTESVIVAKTIPAKQQPNKAESIEKINMEIKEISPSLVEPTITESPKSVEVPVIEKAAAPVIESKPTSYYEKIKNKTKDSLRPIFVPKK